MLLNKSCLSVKAHSDLLATLFGVYVCHLKKQWIFISSCEGKEV